MKDNGICPQPCGRCRLVFTEKILDFQQSGGYKLNIIHKAETQRRRLRPLRRLMFNAIIRIIRAESSRRRAASDVQNVIQGRGLKMRIKEVAEQFGMLPTTLRFYEEKGLIPAVPRDENGVRDYGTFEINWIRFIRCMRSAGCSIAMLQEYSRLCRAGDGTIPERLELLKQQYAALEKRERELQESLKVLRGKIETYDQRLLNCEKELRETETP